MKKIIILCCTLVLLLSMSVPIFAADENDPYDLIGEWTFSNIPSKVSKQYYVDFTAGGTTYSSIKSASSYVYYCNADGNKQIYTSNGTWLGDYRVISIIGGTSLTDETFANWLKANAVKTVEEPETPVPDTGTGDSGSSTTPDSGTTPDDTTPTIPDGFVNYNGTYLPPITSWTEEAFTEKTMLIAEISGASYGDQFANSYYYILDVVPKVEAVVTHNTGYVVYNYKTDTYFARQIYTPDPDLAAVLTAEGNTASTTAWGTSLWADVTPSRSYAVDRIVWSNYNIYNADGSLFFPQPPTTLTGVLEGVQMTAAMTEVVKLIPMVMALLVSYVALRKSLTFLINLLRSA